MKFYKNKETLVYEVCNDYSLENNDNYREVKVGSVAAAREKHVPVYSKNGKKIEVQVGSVMHPMEEEHYIMWIILVKDDEVIERKDLKPGDQPKAEFNYVSDSEIYACCNLHSIWRTEVN